MQLALGGSLRREVTLTFRSLGYPISIIAAGLLGLTVMRNDFRWLLLPVSCFFGLTQLGGRCGIAHLNSMNVIWRFGFRRWVMSVGVYTLAGLVSSSMVGGGIGWLGRIFLPAQPSTNRLGLVALALLASVLTARELGWLQFDIWERKRQTRPEWVHQFGWVIASGLWGFHIGLAFDSVVTYGGFWVLVGVIALFRDPLFGMTVMAAYWIGRSGPLWVLPPFLHGRQFKQSQAYPLFKPIHALGLVSITVAIVARALI